MEFTKLINSIQSTHEELQLSAVKAVNQSLTLRNWLIGLYIVEFEQNGEDRAKYGERLLENIAKSIQIKGLPAPELSRCRQLYKTYPQILGLVTQEFKHLLPTSLPKHYSLENVRHPILGSQTQESQKRSNNNNLKHIFNIFQSISYTHFTELIKIEDATKRHFYETLILKMQPTVKELKRQINTLYYERSEISKKPEMLSKMVKQTAATIEAKNIIKSPFTFEFLGLKAKDVVYENDLEKSLLEHLEGFLLEMGHGFCFEAKQKRILIGGEYFFIDLVFYHRILKCHVLVELKVDEAKHEHIGQLKTYVNYYKKEVMQKDDNPPVGLLLVTNQNKALVEYAIADSDQQLFVSKYLLELPSEEELIAEIERENNVLREQGVVYGREE